MRRVHGEYPFDAVWNGIWKYLMQNVPPRVVEAFLAEVPLVVDDQGELPNKGFRVVRVEYTVAGGKVFAVYKHDDEYHLIQAQEDTFEFIDGARHASLKKVYVPPCERLPYPSY